MVRRTTQIVFSILLILSTHAYGQGNTPIFKGKKVELDGDWNLVMNDFLSYDEAKNPDYSIKIAVPSTWNNAVWNQENVGSHGYGTYFKSIIYDRSLPPTSLGIEVPEISLAYRLYANDQLIGQVGVPGESKTTSFPRVEYKMFDFDVEPGDTVTLIFHISNFQNKSGGLWYAPTINYADKMTRRVELNKSLKLIILGCILIGALFQLSIFILRPSEKFCIYFFMVCVSLIMMLLTRGNMAIMDLFPDLSWVSVKRTLYLSIALIGPSNALFLGEMYKKYFHKKIINAVFAIGLLASVFILFAPVWVSYSIIPVLHGYNILLGLYLFISLIRAAVGGKYGAKFLILGYLAAFVAILYDMLGSFYIIDSNTFDMTHLGIALYLIQLMLLLTSRYLFAMKGKEALSNHLKKVNTELGEMVERRTKALRDKTQIIEKQNAELQKAMQEKDHLMAVVAHDLKAPLSSIMGISEMMGSELEGQNAEFNEMIKKVTIDGRAMIENLTELKVYEQDNYEARATLFNLSHFFEQKRLAFEPSAEKKKIRFNCSLESKKKKICTDENILGRIVDNLISNAIKFTQKGGEIDFIVSVQHKNLNIKISDNGPGFSEKDMSKVFKKFQRLSARPTAGESSAGLGLSIVKTLVELLDGSIDLKSEKGLGATFTVSIPV